MVLLNDYLYSGDTVLRILHNYIKDLRKDAKRTGNEIDMIHCNFLLQVQELLEHNDFLTAQSQKIREFYKYMTKEYPYLAFTVKGRIKSLIRAEEKFNGYIVKYISDYYEEYGKDFYSPKHMEKIAQLFEVPVETLLDDYNLFLRKGQGEQIKTIRTKLGLTQREYADKLSVSLGSLKQWEQNRKQIFKSTWERYFKQSLESRE